MAFDNDLVLALLFVGHWERRRRGALRGRLVVGRHRSCGGGVELLGGGAWYGLDGTRNRHLAVRSGVSEVVQALLVECGLDLVIEGRAGLGEVASLKSSGGRCRIYDKADRL